MLQELLFVDFFDDDTSIIHKPFPHQRGVWWCTDGSCLKTFHVQVCHYWADWRAHGSTFPPAHSIGFGKWSKYSWDKLPKDRWCSWLSWLFFHVAQGLLPVIFLWWWGQVGWALSWKVPLHHMILLLHLDSCGCLLGVVGNLHYCVHGVVTFPPGASGSLTVP